MMSQKRVMMFQKRVMMFQKRAMMSQNCIMLLQKRIMLLQKRVTLSQNCITLLQILLPFPQKHLKLLQNCEMIFKSPILFSKTFESFYQIAQICLGEHQSKLLSTKKRPQSLAAFFQLNNTINCKLQSRQKNQCKDQALVRRQPVSQLQR